MVKLLGHSHSFHQQFEMKKKLMIINIEDRMEKLSSVNALGNGGKFFFMHSHMLSCKVIFEAWHFIIFLSEFSNFFTLYHNCQILWIGQIAFILIQS